MTSNNADSSRNVIKYTGQNYRFTPTYVRQRDPTTLDLKDPANQGYYPINSLWTNKTNQNLWVLVGIIANVAKWVMLSTGSSGPVTDLKGDDTVTVIPTALGIINLIGTVVANATHAKAVFTKSPSANTESIDIQVGAAIASTDVTKVGLAAFSNGQFTVDANGFVALVGGTGPSIQTLTPDSGGAVSPVTGTITIHGTNGVNTTNGGAGQLNVNGITATTAQIGVTTLATNAQTQAGTYGTTQVVTAGNIISMMAIPSPLGSTTSNTGQFTQLAVGGAANPPALGSGNGINFNNTKTSSGLSSAVTSNNMPYYEIGTYTPTVDGATPGATTYVSQAGNYMRLGNLVFCQAQIAISAATGIGDARFALPFTSSVATQGTVGSFLIGSTAWAWPASVTYFCANVQGTTTYLVASGSGSGLATPSKLQMSNNIASFFYTAVFQV